MKPLRPIIRTSVFELFKIGPGPSSSHTIGPMKAANDFIDLLNALPSDQAAKGRRIEVRLYGSLSATGKGHGTDRAALAGLLGQTPETCPPDFLQTLAATGETPRRSAVASADINVSLSDIVFAETIHEFPFSNTLAMALLGPEEPGGPDVALVEREYYSVGGGFIQWKGYVEPPRGQPALPYSTMEELKAVMQRKSIRLHDVIMENEMAITGASYEEIIQGLDRILDVMDEAVQRGLGETGLLPGPIGLHRKAAAIRGEMERMPHGAGQLILALDAAAFAVAEENAAGGRVVTAPTSGSAGVIPAVAHVMVVALGLDRENIRQGLLAAAAIGFLAKNNASIAGAEVGCQGEIGVASSMAAAMITYARGFGIDLTENAAQTALEHHLGMTCDPVGGYVQIPCIERNAMGAIKAFNSHFIATAVPAMYSRVGLDQTIQAMYATGCAMPREFKETALGGLAACDILC